MLYTDQDLAAAIHAHRRQRSVAAAERHRLAKLLRSRTSLRERVATAMRVPWGRAGGRSEDAVTDRGVRTHGRRGERLASGDPRRTAVGHL